MIQSKDVEYRYGTYLKQSIDYISAQHLRVVGGRGTTKTTDIQADRSMDVVYDMPRSVLGFVSDTFVNARDKIIPKLVEGWREYKGWKEGVHYVIDERPPHHFGDPYTPIVTYKNTISIFNGCIFKVGSLDQPSGLAGDSFQHLFGDEVKFFDKKVLDIVLPALRGYSKVQYSPFYRGTTFTTDYPNISKKQHDWILEEKAGMNVQQIKDAFYAGHVLNQINWKLKQAYDLRDKNAIQRYKKQRDRWLVKWYAVRKNTTFYVVVSSLVNLDILTPEYVFDQLDRLGWEEFRQSVLSFKSKLETGDRFYTGLSDDHFFEDGLIYTTDYINAGIKGHQEPTSAMLRYITPNDPLDCGIDFGKMISMPIGQEHGKYYDILKFMHTLVPESSKELGERFRKFFAPHKNKLLYMWYDRSGNQYKSSGRDWATEIKNHIEKDSSGRSTGWVVKLMSKDQGNITQDEEYMFMKQLMQGTTKGLPKLRIDALQCRELKSSLELAKLIVAKDKNGATVIKKDKSSESLPLSKLPMQSTNPSDAFKYMLYRKQWVNLVKDRGSNLPTGLDGGV